MSYIEIDRGQSYTVPVDSIDLNYLSQYVGSAMERKPLWTKTRLNGEASYCQVQILTQNGDECYSEPTATYECHICNVRVPVACSKPHNESEQHKTIKNIYQKVLEKLSKQIDINITNNDEEVDKDAYFCVPCSKICKKENKDKHESTEFHAKSIKDTIIISEFYKIIKEDRNSSDDMILIEEGLGADSILEPVNTTAFKDNNNYATTTNKLNNNYLSNNNDLPTVANKLVIPGPSCDNKIKTSNDEKPDTFKEYLKAMVNRYKLKVNLPTVMYEKVQIESSNGNLVTVTRDHFQGYIQLKNSIYCQLCKMWISMDTKPHDVTENHVRKIFKPIDEKFARMIDSVSSHCVPCNKVILTNDGDVQHILNDEHKKIVKDTRVQKKGKTFCEDCNLYIDTHNFAVHLISKKHLNGIMIQNFITTTENPKIFFCKLCNLTVSKKGVTNHVLAKTHVTNKINKNGATNLGTNNTDSNKTSDKNTNSAKVNDQNAGSPAVGTIVKNSEYCKICNVEVPIGGMVIHVDGKAHKMNRVKQLNNNDNKPQENRAQSSSTSTNSNNLVSPSTSTDSEISATTISDDTMDAYYNLVEYVNDSDIEVRCKICLTYMPFAESYFIEHMKSKFHVERMTEQKIDKYIKLLYYTDDAKTMVKCEICHVNVPNVERNVIEHMEGRNHEIAETGLLQFHMMTRDLSMEYECDCCDIQTTDYLDHINSESHTNTFLLNQDIDRNEMRNYVYEDDIDDVVARRYRQLHRNLLKHNSIYKLNETSFYCGMCQIKLGRISELDHVLGERHALKLKELRNYDD